MRIRAVIVVIWLWLTLGETTNVVAQNDSSRGELFENLLRSLIESRVEDSQQAERYYPAPPTNPVPAELQESERIFGQFEQEAGRLFDFLSQDARTRRELRVHLNPTLQVQADATVLYRLTRQNGNATAIRAEFVNLDQDWRALSHQLESAIGLSAQTRASVRKLDSYDRRLNELFDVSPQIAERQFLRLIDTLSNDLQYLLDDIAIELGRTQQGRQLLIQGRLIEQQLRYMAAAIEDRNSRDAVVSEFEKFNALWEPFAGQLWPLKNRYLERGLQRIEKTERELRDVLWLTTEIDNRQLIRLTDVLVEDVDQLYQATNLKVLMNLDSQRSQEGYIRQISNYRDSFMDAAQSFHNANKTFKESVKGNGQLEQLQNEFRNVQQKWEDLEASYRGVSQPEILRLLKSTDQTIVSIQQALQMDSVFDRNKAMQILASLENHGEHLQEDFSTIVLPNSRYNRQFSIQGLHTSQQFTAFARQIHYDLAEGVDPEDVRARCNTLVRGWNYLNGEFIHKLEGREREELNHISSQITPLIVQLQTMFDV